MWACITNNLFYYVVIAGRERCSLNIRFHARDDVAVLFCIGLASYFVIVVTTRHGASPVVTRRDNEREMKNRHNGACHTHIFHVSPPPIPHLKGK